MIQTSERKISAIGNRLIYVAKDKLQEDSILYQKGCDVNYKMEGQNSTIKIGLIHYLQHTKQLNHVIIHKINNLR